MIDPPRVDESPKSEGVPTEDQKQRAHGAQPYPDRAEQIVDFVRAFLRREDYNPSYEQIAAGVGLFAKSSVQHHVQHLVRDGRLRLLPNRRGVTLGPEEVKEDAESLAYYLKHWAIELRETDKITSQLLFRAESFIRHFCREADQ